MRPCSFNYVTSYKLPCVDHPINLEVRPDATVALYSSPSLFCTYAKVLTKLQVSQHYLDTSITLYPKINQVTTNKLEYPILSLQHQLLRQKPQSVHRASRFLNIPAKMTMYQKQDLTQFLAYLKIFTSQRTLSWIGWAVMLVINEVIRRQTFPALQHSRVLNITSSCQPKSLSSTQMMQGLTPFGAILHFRRQGLASSMISSILSQTVSIGPLPSHSRWLVVLYTHDIARCWCCLKQLGIVLAFSLILFRHFRRTWLSSYNLILGRPVFVRPSFTVKNWDDVMAPLTSLMGAYAHLLVYA